MIKFLTILFLLSSVCYAQTGSIRVKKVKNNLIGKTLHLADVKGDSAGMIAFVNDTICKLNSLSFVKDNEVIALHGKRLNKDKKHQAKYKLLSDSTLVVKHKNFSDTCYYNYVNEFANLVQFKQALLGEFPSEYVVFFDLDSVFISTSFLKNKANRALVETRLKNDTLFDYVTDKKKRKALLADYRKDLKETLNNQYNYFIGSYEFKNGRYYLIGRVGQRFAHFSIRVDTANNFTLKMKALEKTFYEASNVKKGRAAQVKLVYDKAYVLKNHSYYKRVLTDTKINKKIQENSYDLIYAREYKITLAKNDSIFDLYSYAKGANKNIGGCYPLQLKALNGEIYDSTTVCFLENKKAIIVNDSFDIISRFNYAVNDTFLALFNETDTLIDLLHNQSAVEVSYINDLSIIKGAYHSDDVKGMHDIIVLFDNGRGVSIKSKAYKYKQARALLSNRGAHLIYPQKGITLFKYTAGEEFLWIEYENGDYEKLSFFNFHQGIKRRDKRKDTNYYLIN